jgi:acetyl-CoA synthetase
MFREKFPVPDEWAKRAWADEAKYQEMYQRSIDDPEGFWGDEGKRLDWIKPYTKVKDTSFDADDLHVRWYYDGVLNASANCLDRHLDKRGDQVAIIWEGDDPADDDTLTYRDLYERVCRFANGLKSLGVKKGDRVTIYLPMIPEIAVAMLACARIGAVHSVVFGGFSPESISGRIHDCESSFVITADEGLRGGRTIPLKANVDAAIERLTVEHIDQVVVVNRTGADINWVEGRDVWYHELVAEQSTDCPPEPMDAEDPLFILYTSGSTGKPKGVLHTTGGYMVFASMTHQYVFDYHDGDIYWCTADCGWVTGHSYIVYGPLANGATTLIFEGLPNYPDASRHWQVCDKHSVNIYYTAPTAIRALMREGDEPVKKTSRQSIRLLGTVGEPINPEAWHWYHQVVGDDRCPIVDTWWQTETGGILLTPLPGATLLKPGSATKPFFGIQPVIVDNDGTVLEGACEGILCIDGSWPGQMRTVYGDHQRFVDTYFKAYPGLFFTGDGCRRDEGRRRLSPRHQRAGHLRLCHLESGCRGDRRTARRADQVRAHRDRPDRHARSAAVGAGVAEDALGQDHAPYPAQDRRQRARPVGRYHHPGRPHGGRPSGG